MVTVDPEALSQVLSAIDLRVGIGRRQLLETGALLALAPGDATLVYVADGAVHGIPPLDAGCRLDVDRESRLVEVDAHDRSTVLRTGDAFLTLGRGPLALAAEQETTLIVVALDLADPAPPLDGVLPDYITVTAFDELEPAAASLAENMGPAVPSARPKSKSDPLICRLMATTVLLSVIRAWAENGCAPEGWPRIAADPFLERVVEAIHEEPGREWTVERLATVGAMSRSVFAERFRSAIGRSPADYVTEVRIDAAKRMLDAGRTVAETSRELGYASDEGFSRAFRRRTGVTPSAWRTAAPASVPA
ncbi:helix-turn-helix transcriptional regulator [Streptomyces sp. AC495_CC817]|uniref:helix-turn-helix transcriptional regulator n=1 Tax=Streptomyces sp. AC495_CC817 TaxID=2823900 RepID=UPI001C25ABFE|nr:AraC family transcriptional regulator [Streptomyces sp. AC495_CC817]